MALTPPVYIPEPFANQADPADIIAIPDVDPGNGQPSYQKGAPNSNMQPLVPSGTPFSGPGYNGTMNAAFQHIVWALRGQKYPYNATFDTGANGPYPVGSVVQSSDGAGFWIKYANASSVVDPESSSGPASWFPTDFTGVLNLGAIAGTVTLTPLQGARSVITANTSTGSAAVLVLPNWPGYSWNLINTDTAVPIPVQIGSTTITLAPLGPTQAMGVLNYNDFPLITYQPAAALNISMSATNNSLAQRDGSANLTANRFIQTANDEAAPFENIFVDPGTGALAKIAIAAFVSQMGLAITNGPEFTGVPLTPTAEPGTDSEQISSTAFVAAAIAALAVEVLPTLSTSGSTVRLSIPVAGGGAPFQILLGQVAQTGSGEVSGQTSALPGGGFPTQCFFPFLLANGGTPMFAQSWTKTTFTWGTGYTGGVTATAIFVIAFGR